MLSASQESFCRARGLGEAKFVQLQAVMELARRHLEEPLHREHVFTSPALVGEFLLAQLRHLPARGFRCIVFGYPASADCVGKTIFWHG